MTKQPDKAFRQWLVEQRKGRQHDLEELQGKYLRALYLLNCFDGAIKKLGLPTLTDSVRCDINAELCRIMRDLMGLKDRFIDCPDMRDRYEFDCWREARDKAA